MTTRRTLLKSAAIVALTLAAPASGRPDGPVPTYLDMMRHNARTLAQALSS